MIKNLSNVGHFFWGDNCERWEFLISDDLIVVQEKMPPGTAEQMHFHKKAQQFFYILSGIATFNVEGQLFKLKANEGISILPNVMHQFSNREEEDLNFLLISQPTSKEDRYNI